MESVLAGVVFDFVQRSMQLSRFQEVCARIM